MKRTLLAAAVALVPCLALAHVSIPAAPYYANATQEVLFTVGHGCAGSDTAKIRIEIPAGITSVRASSSDIGRASIITDAAGLVTAVEFAKPVGEAEASDFRYYHASLRLKLPNTPFATLYFPVTQTCRNPTGIETVVHWSTTPSMPGDAGVDEPAASLTLLPARKPGWNKFSVPRAVDAAELATLFADAQIVWKGTAAFSTNPATVEQIAGTSGVSALSTLAAGDEIWVKY